MPVSGRGVSVFPTGISKVQDEGVTIEDNALCLNFIGAEVEAKPGSDGLVNVYIPTPGYSSNFGTSNGNTDATVINPTTEIRHVSAPGSFSIGDWVPESLQQSLNNNSINYSTNGLFSLFDLTTDFKVEVIDADGSTVLASHIVNDISGDISTTQNNITITVNNFQVDNDLYKCGISVDVDCHIILGQGGRFSVVLTHYNASNGTYSHSHNDIFYDTDSIQSSISGLTITESTPVIKELSGVRYYDLGSTFNIQIPDIDNINYISYETNFIQVNSSTYGIPDFNVSSPDLIGWTNAFDNINASYNGTKQITESNLIVSSTQTINALTKDWTDGSPIYTSNQDVLINTYGIESSDIAEYFTDENKRLTSSFTSFDSSALLSDTDLFVFGGVLKRRIGDYTGFIPLNTANYTDVVDEQCFYREFKHDLTSHSNGIFAISGITEQNITDDDVKIEISLDNVNWYNVNEDYLGGSLNNNDGCRIDKTLYNLDLNGKIRFTLGTGGFTDIGTGPSDYGIYFKVCMPQGSSVEIDSIVLEDWV